MVKARITIFWFRRDLRLHDNHGLFKALESSATVLPIFVFDKTILSGLSDKKDKRITFIYQTLRSLNDQLRLVGSSLKVLHDTPEEAFSLLSEEYEIEAVYTNHDYEPYAIQRDKRIREWLDTKQILFHTFKDQVIFEKDEILKSDGSPYIKFTPYANAWKSKLNESALEKRPSQKQFYKLVKTSPFHFPSLGEIGFDDSDVSVPSPMISHDIIKNYHLTRNIPAIRGTSQLSVHLRFGTVSIRELVQKALLLNDQWLNELIWREFFMMILFHFPHVVHQSFKPKYDYIEWRNNEFEFERWCQGQTGYPIVDAGMRELNATGLMHNRVRMIVASFLTKHLLIDWRWGEGYFAEKLLDYELSSNNGNWQWAAGCGTDAAPYFRIFNPYEQTKKFDPNQAYIKKWVPDLFDHYPEPIVDHVSARNRALAAYKSALSKWS